MALDLETYIGREKEADGYDIRKVKAALNRLGYYTPDETAGITEEAEPAFFNALKAFQRQNGIEPDGRIGPGSLSERALNDAVKTHNAGSLFAGWYIWRTVGDEKVRGNHAQREAQIFSWDNPPTEANPKDLFGSFKEANKSFAFASRRPPRRRLQLPLLGGSVLSRLCRTPRPRDGVDGAQAGT